MLQLTVIRHAKAQAAEDDEQDFERPLSARGRDEAALMAARARDLDLMPDYLVTSPAARTVATARAFARALRVPLPRVHRDERLYLADADTILSVAREVPAHCRHVMLIGHNPGLSDFAARLTGDSPLRELPTGALLSMEIAADAWRHAAWRRGERLLYDWPGSLEEEW